MTTQQLILSLVLATMVFSVALELHAGEGCRTPGRRVRSGQRAA